MSYVFSALQTRKPGGNVRSKPVVFVSDSSGNVGRETVNALSMKYGRKLDIRAGVARAELLRDVKAANGVSMAVVRMGDDSALKDALKDVNTLFIVTPCDENRVELVSRTLDAAKEAGVEHIVITSGENAKKPDNMFGGQFRDIEQAVADVQIPYTILRLPWFMENCFTLNKTLNEAFMFYAPVDPTRVFPTVCASDVGTAAAAVLASPQEHAGKVYSVVSDRSSFGQVSEAMSRALSRKIVLKRESYDEAKQRLVEARVPEWMIEGYLGFCRSLEDDTALGSYEDHHYRLITGKNPTKLVTWINRYASVYK